MKEKQFRDLNQLLLHDTESEGFLTLLPDAVREEIGLRGAEIHSFRDLRDLSRALMQERRARYGS